MMFVYKSFTLFKSVSSLKLITVLDPEKINPTKALTFVSKIFKSHKGQWFKLISLLVLVLLVLTTNMSYGQEPTLIIENGRVIVGNGTVLKQGTVVITRDRVDVVVKGPVDVPSARRMDASGKTIMPGLIDAHVHLLVGDSEYSNPPVPIQMDDSLAEAYIENHLPAKLRAYLKAGITTIRSTGDYWPEITEVKGRLLSGELSGPRLEVVGPVFTGQGHPAQKCRKADEWNEWCRSHLVVMLEDPQGAKKAVRRVAESGVDAIKIVGLDHGGLSDRSIIRTIASEADKQGIPTIMHVMTQEHAFDALIWGTDQFVHSPILNPDTTLTNNMLSFMHENGVYAVSTISINEENRKEELQQGNRERAEWARQQVEKIQRAARIYADEELLVFGTDVPMLTPEEALHQEIRLLQEAGLRPAQIIQAATQNAARQLGREDIGILKSGNKADLIIVDGNPLKNINALKNIETVVKDGEIVAEN